MVSTLLLDYACRSQEQTDELDMELDVAIIGGGPGGSTCGGLLKKYAPELSVGIFEREEFPRDHVGESQLPPISKILHELGCWDDIGLQISPSRLARLTVGATVRSFGTLSSCRSEPTKKKPGQDHGVRKHSNWRFR